MTERPLIAFRLGDVIRLKRTHPCGGSSWLIDRLGADLGLRCTRCGRHILVARPRVEARLVGFDARGDEALSAAVTPTPRDAAR